MTLTYKNQYISPGPKQTQAAFMGFQTRFDSRQDAPPRDSGRGRGLPPRGRGGKDGNNRGLGPGNRNQPGPGTSREQYDNRNGQRQYSEDHHGGVANSYSNDYYYRQDQDRYSGDYQYRPNNQYRGNQYKGNQRNNQYQGQRNRWENRN